MPTAININNATFSVLRLSQLVSFFFGLPTTLRMAFIKRKQNKFYINICHITKGNFNDFCRCKIIVREFFAATHKSLFFFFFFLAGGGEKETGRTQLAFNVLLAFNFTDCRPFYALATLLTFILRRWRWLPRFSNSYSLYINPRRMPPPACWLFRRGCRD